MFLNADEILLILDALRDKYGPGYCLEVHQCFAKEEGHRGAHVCHCGARWP